MERYYFTFMMSDVQRHNCYHVEEAETYGEARDKMVEKFGTGWAFNMTKISGKYPRNSTKGSTAATLLTPIGLRV